jgi:hypothetical protein
MVHVVYELFRGREPAVDDRFDHGDATAGRLRLYAICTIRGAGGEAGPAPHALKYVAVIVDIQGSESPGDLL